MSSNNDLKYENSRTFRQYLRELCMRGLPRSVYKSPRAFDKVLQMAQHWLSFIIYSTGYRNTTRHFIAIDGRDFDDNPLAISMKTKEFKPNHLIAHLAILNLLNTEDFIPVARLIIGTPDELRWKRHGEGEKDLVAAIANKKRMINSFHLPNAEIDIDQKCIRETLAAYVELGVIECRRNGNRNEYRIRKEAFSLEQMKDYLSFCSGLSPIELVGSIIKDRCIRRLGEIDESPFRFKYRYFHHILDAEVIEMILNGIHEHRPLVVQMSEIPDVDARPHILPKHFELKTVGKFCGHTTKVIPLKLYMSVRTGRRYLMGLYRDSLDLASIRVERIEQIAFETDDNGGIIKLSDEAYRDAAERFREISEHLWGVSYRGKQAELVHISFEINDKRPNAPKVRRLAREKRSGTVTEIAPNRARFEADVYDGRELFPWIRTYIGYLSNLSFSDATLTDLFWKQFREMKGKLYDISSNI